MVSDRFDLGEEGVAEGLRRLELAAAVFQSLKEASGGAGGDVAVAEGGDDELDEFLEVGGIAGCANPGVIATPADADLGAGHGAGLGCGQIGLPGILAAGPAGLMVATVIGVAIGIAAAALAVVEEIVADVHGDTP